MERGEENGKDAQGFPVGFLCVFCMEIAWVFIRVHGRFLEAKEVEEKHEYGEHGGERERQMMGN